MRENVGVPCQATGVQAPCRGYVGDSFGDMTTRATQKNLTKFSNEQVVHKYGIMYLMNGQIKLTQGQIAIVDIEDFDEMSSIRWMAQWSKFTKSFYAIGWTGGGTKTRKRLYMHRVLMGNPKKPFMVDHINHDTLDNRRENLRIVSASGNAINSKSYSGNKKVLEIDPKILEMKQVWTCRFCGHQWLVFDLDRVPDKCAKCRKRGWQ